MEHQISYAPAYQITPISVIWNTMYTSLTLLHLSFLFIFKLVENSSFTSLRDTYYIYVYINDMAVAVRLPRTWNNFFRRIVGYESQPIYITWVLIEIQRWTERYQARMLFIHLHHLAMYLFCQCTRVLSPMSFSPSWWMSSLVGTKSLGGRQNLVYNYT